MHFFGLWLMAVSMALYEYRNIDIYGSELFHVKHITIYEYLNIWVVYYLLYTDIHIYWLFHVKRFMWNISHFVYSSINIYRLFHDDCFTWNIYHFIYSNIHIYPFLYTVSNKLQYIITVNEFPTKSVEIVSHYRA